jgi:hypothetical protein
MNVPTLTESPRRRRLPRLHSAFLLVSLSISAFGMSTAMAQALDPPVVPADAAPAPWAPAAVMGTSPYILDPSFQDGVYSVDLFGGSANSDYQARVTVRLANGNTVTAGLVPPFNSGNPVSGLWNIGLVLHNSAGNRVQWPNPGSYGFLSNNYVIFPNSADARYQYIRDIKAINGYLYVFADLQHDTPAAGRQDSFILIFREDGSYINTMSAFGLFDDRDHFGATLAQLTDTTLIAAATAYDSIGPIIRVTKFDIQGSGLLLRDEDFGDAGYGTYFADALCAAHPCAAVARAAKVAEGVPIAGVPSVYIVGSVNYDGGEDWDALVLNISGTSGIPVTSFSSDGWQRIAFDDDEGGLTDYGAGLAAVRSLVLPGPSFRTDLYLVAEIDRRCHNGIGVAKLDGTGALVSAFGTGGKTVFGGQGNAPFCFGPGNNSDVPVDMVRNGDRLGIVGFGFTSIVSGASRVDPMLAVVNTATGAVMDIARHPVERPDGSRWGDGQLFGVTGAADGTFTVAGHARDASTTNRLMYVTGRFAGDDTIFANGFE